MKLRSPLALTLIEFLLAMAIFATIAVSVYATFFNGIQISKKAKNFEGFYRNIRFTIDAMQYDLENMVPYEFDTQDPPILAFSGDDKSFNLIVPSESGIKKVKYFLDDPKSVRIHKVQMGKRSSKNVTVTTGDIVNQPPSSVLIRQEQAWGQEPSDEILNKQVAKDSLKISYASMGDEHIMWNNQWTDTSFPLGIKLQLTFIDPSDPQHAIPIEKIIYVPLGTTKKISNDAKSEK